MTNNLDIKINNYKKHIDFLKENTSLKHELKNFLIHYTEKRIQILEEYKEILNNQIK